MDDESCREMLFRIRWPLGFACPHCGHKRYYTVPDRGQYECAACGAQIALTGGTIMHKSKVPLHKWFEAIVLYNEDPTISAVKMARIAGLTKPTASLLLKKIRKSLTSQKGQVFLGRIATAGSYRG
jgi:DNA-directed RNA polymerase subunit RPC12/RpoP